MRSFPPLRAIWRHLALLGGALLLTQVPAWALMMHFGRPGAITAVSYALASVGAAGGLFAVTLAFRKRVDRIVGLVQRYAEEGRLPAIDPLDGGSMVRVKASLSSLDGIVRSLEAEAALDPLTGIYNRRTCAARLEGDLARSRRGDVPFCIALFDLDELKSINDLHGHSAGDTALKHFAHVLRDIVREGDWAARWGGDEFLLALWAVGRDDAEGIVRRVMTRLTAEAIDLHGIKVNVNSSVGLAVAAPSDTTNDLFARADVALLEAKRSGRGRARLSDGSA